MNVSGIESAPARVPPTEQRFHCQDAPGRDLHLGLVEELELVVLDRVVQVGEQTQTVGAEGVGLPAVAHHAGAGDCFAAYIATSACCSTVSASPPSAGQQAIPTLASTSTDTFASVMGFPSVGADGLRGGDRGRGLGVGEQHGELVAAESGDDVAGSDRGLEPRAELAEQQVAAVVAERVVDLLEAVEVDEQERHPAAVATMSLDRLLEARVEHGTVRRAR